LLVGRFDRKRTIDRVLQSCWRYGGAVVDRGLDAYHVNMIVNRFTRVLLCCVVGIVALVAVVASGGGASSDTSLKRSNGIVYGQRGERELMFDVLTPAKPNGLGVLVMVSGGWKSGTPGSFADWMGTPFLQRGYTLIAVYHVSQPEATVMQIIEDVHRAVRFVRHHARDYGIDPQRLGVTGGSAGGHLSLMLATTGKAGPKDAIDPVDRESSAVQAAAVFFPVTDLLNLGKSTENPGDGGPPKSFHGAFGPDCTDPVTWKKIAWQCSPIYHITKEIPPVLIHHGDKDTLTPLEQSEWFRDKARKAGRTVKLVVQRGGEHGWISMPLNMTRFADWFDTHLQDKDDSKRQDDQPADD
jgi:acetyl esterase/lipase